MNKTTKAIVFAIVGIIGGALGYYLGSRSNELKQALEDDAKYGLY